MLFFQSGQLLIKFNWSLIWSCLIFTYSSELQLVAKAQQAKQTMMEAAEAMDVCRRVPKPDRDEMLGEQVSRAWLATAPNAAAEKQDKSTLLRDMVEAYSKAMQADGQLIAMGCSQGVLDRVQGLNWSPFHVGVSTVLKANGMGGLINP